jgi:hypothetical protein
MRRETGSIALLAPILAASASFAWSPVTRVHMVEDAARLMPAGLRLALESHRDDVRRGLLTPLVEGDVPARRPPWTGGHLDASVETAALELERSLAAGAKFGAVAEGLGPLAHFVAEASFPPAAGPRDADRRYRDFSDFCESRRERFPLVFAGHDAPELARHDWRAYALRLLTAGRADDQELARAYAAAGDRRDPAYFDDRSVPFAIGSLSYSRAVSSIVQAWLSAWRAADGDLGATPYLGLDPAAPPGGEVRPR